MVTASAGCVREVSAITNAAIFLWVFILPFGEAGALRALGWSSYFNSFQLGDDHDAGHRLFDYVDNHSFFGWLEPAVAARLSWAQCALPAA